VHDVDTNGCIDSLNCLIPFAFLDGTRLCTRLPYETCRKTSEYPRRGVRARALGAGRALVAKKGHRSIVLASSAAVRRPWQEIAPPRQHITVRLARLAWRASRTVQRSAQRMMVLDRHNRRITNNENL
jgi:hypothetical protein